MWPNTGGMSAFIHLAHLPLDKCPSLYAFSIASQEAQRTLWPKPP
jgi:hypothetical protein